MKPTFRKSVLDLVEWHQPVNLVITETRIVGSRADDIIRRLPFDGAYPRRQLAMLVEFGCYVAQTLFPWTFSQPRSRKFTPLSRLDPLPYPGF